MSRAPTTRRPRHHGVTVLDIDIELVERVAAEVSEVLLQTFTSTLCRVRSPRRLAAERAAFAVREAGLAGDLTAEKARTDRAIAAFASLAERLDALAACYLKRRT